MNDETNHEDIDPGEPIPELATLEGVSGERFERR